MSDLVIPKTTSETMKKVLLAYYLCYNDTGVTVKEVTEKTGCLKKSISRVNPFFLEINLLSKINGRYLLTDSGKQYIELLENSQIEEANELLRNLLLDYEQLKFILFKIKLEKGLNYDKLSKRIEELSGADLSISDHKTGIKGFIDLLIETNILLRTEDQLYLVNVDLIQI